MKKVNKVYIMSHLKLRDEIYFNWRIFNYYLLIGGNKLKQHLCNLFDSIKEKDYNDNFSISDLEAKVSIEDFDFGVMNIANINVLFIELPKSSLICNQAKIIAIAFSKGSPRYFMLEVKSSSKYLIGEWLLKDNIFVHIDYAEVKDDYLTNFVKILNFILTDEVLKNEKMLSNN